MRLCEYLGTCGYDPVPRSYQSEASDPFLTGLYDMKPPSIFIELYNKGSYVLLVGHIFLLVPRRQVLKFTGKLEKSTDIFAAVANS